MWGCFFKGPEANQPTEVAAQLETIEVNEDLFKELQEAVQQDEANTQEIDGSVPFGTKIMFDPYCVYKFKSMNV